MSADPAGSPRGMFLVNDVEINHDEDSFYSETEDSFSEQNTTLKRFGAFEDLDKIDSLDQPDFIHNIFKKNSVEKENNLRQHEVDVVQSVPGDHVGGDMNETIEEIEVEIRREKGSYGFSIMVNILHNVWGKTTVTVFVFCFLSSNYICKICKHKNMLA